jgi:hypothetical protein
MDTITELRKTLIRLFPNFENDFRVWENHGKSRIYNGKKYYELNNGVVYTNHTAWVMDLKDAGLKVERV